MQERQFNLAVTNLLVYARLASVGQQHTALVQALDDVLSSQLQKATPAQRIRLRKLADVLNKLVGDEVRNDDIAAARAEASRWLANGRKDVADELHALSESFGGFDGPASASSVVRCDK